MQHLEEIKEHITEFLDRLYTGLFDFKSMEAVVSEEIASLEAEYTDVEKRLHDIKERYNYAKQPYAAESANTPEIVKARKEAKEENEAALKNKAARAFAAIAGDDDDDDYDGVINA